MFSFKRWCSLKENQKIAVVLFNLGGPDQLDAVKPFLFNLFYDPAILNLPNPFRWFLAKLISHQREPIAKKIYQQIGGSSPILKNTIAQAKHLEKTLNEKAPDNFKVFSCMRYWNPRGEDVVALVKKFQPAKILLIPLYPQFSTTTTLSSISDWIDCTEKQNLSIPTKALCCYPDDPDLILAMAQLIKKGLKKAKEGEIKLLLSAHGLPEKIIRSGDPYQEQVEKTAKKLINVLGKYRDIPKFDHAVCYQSKVGPLKWIGPSTEDEIMLAGKRKLSLVIFPIAFVSEHSETLVELDIGYQELAKKSGVKKYIRVPTVSTSKRFISCLAMNALTTLKSKNFYCKKASLCSNERTKCPLVS